MRVALVSLYDVENAAVRQMAPYLRRRGHPTLEVFFKDWVNNHLDWPGEDEIDALIDLLRREGVGLVGLSLRASAYLRVAIHLTSRIRDALSLPVVWGGIHPTLNPESCVGVADFIVVGEGELALAELLDRMDHGLPTGDVGNVWSRQQGVVLRNAIRPLLDPIEEATERDWEHPDRVWMDGRRLSRRDPMRSDPTYLLFASRGCVFRCSFCYHSTLREAYEHKGAYYRYRGVDHVLDELKRARAWFPAMRRVRFDDEVFIPDRRWVRDFSQRYGAEVGLPFECFIEPRLVDEERMAQLRDAGLSTVHMGIQAADRVSTELYDRPSNEDCLERAARLFQRLGIVPRYLIIVDDPLSTAEDRQRLLHMLLGFPRPFDVYLFSLTVFPGTTLERKLVDAGLVGADEVEGAATKTFDQYRVDLGWDRPADERAWLSLLVLANKPFLPAPVLRRISERQDLARLAPVLVASAQAANAVNMALRVPGMMRSGEVSPRVLRRFLNPRSWITQ